MYAQVKKSKETRSQSVANTFSSKKASSESTFQFVDNRPEAIVQRQLQEMANNSPQVRQALQFKSLSASHAPIQLAGDKMAFEKTDSDVVEEQRLQEIIVDTIERHRTTKKQRKDRIEAEKDYAIDDADHSVAIPKNATADEEREILREPKRRALRRFVRNYGMGGWNLGNLQAEILDATRKQVKFGRKDNHEIPVLKTDNNKKIYSIFFGDDRFNPINPEQEEALPNQVFVKKGTTKEYVQDERNVYIPRYAFRGCSKKQLVYLLSHGRSMPRNNTDIIGEAQAAKFDFGERGPKGSMTQKEKEFVQLRDGSGPDQRLLSITHAKETTRVFGNHGDEFTSEATVKIDLAKILKERIFNQHMDESRQGMIGLPNKERNTSWEEELDNAIYSVIKNRETLIQELPRDAIVEVKVAKGDWMNLHQARMMFDRTYEIEQENKAEATRKAQNKEEERTAKKASNAKARATSAAADVENRNKTKKAYEELARNVQNFIGRMKPRDKKKAGLNQEVENHLTFSLASFITQAVDEGKFAFTDAPSASMINELITMAKKEL